MLKAILTPTIVSSGGWTFRRELRSTPFEPPLYDNFTKYLEQRIVKHAASHYLNLVKQYGDVLVTGDAKPLLTISSGRRRHVMAALTHFAEYNGVKHIFKQIKERYGLTWSSKKAPDLFAKPNITTMLKQLLEIKPFLTPDMWNSFVFDVMTGLRASESLNAIKLIQQNAESYYNVELGVLEHFRFKELFLRNSKNAYISIVNDTMLQIAKQACSSYMQIQEHLRRKHKKPIKMSHCRKIFATYLRDKGIPSEVIDLLQGRVNSSIFATHYYRPDFSRYADKIRTILGELRQQLDPVAAK